MTETEFFIKTINCPNCVGSVEIEENGVYATCSYCGSKMYFKDNEIHLLTETIGVYSGLRK